MSTDTASPKTAVASVATNVRESYRVDEGHERPLVPHSQVDTVFGTRSGIPTVACYLACDVLSIGLSLGLMQMVLFLVGLSSLNPPAEIRLAIGFSAVALITCFYQGLYTTVVLKPARELRQIWLTAIGLAIMFAAVQWTIVVERPLSLLWLVLSALSLGAIQPLVRASCRGCFGDQKWWGRRVLLVGCGEKSGTMYRALRKAAVYGLRPVGYVEDFDRLNEDDDGEGYLGPIAEVSERASEYGVSLALVATGGNGLRPEISNLVCRHNSGIVDWLMVPDCSGLPCLWNNAGEVAGMPAFGVSNQLRSPWRRGIKRAFDLAIAIAIAPIVFPLIGLLALIVRLSSRGNPFYASERIGRDGKRFRMWKLRTMVVDADAVLESYLKQHPELREEWERDKKLKNDPRILWIGSFMRKASLDEIPQIWNILKGEMSIVGPRPMLVSELQKYGEVYEEYRLVPPGVTGMWQINGRNNTSYDDRLAYVEYYVKNWSLWLDFHIMICTVKVVLLREGAY